MDDDLREEVAMLLRRHTFWNANHSSIGPEAHCLCGERPRGFPEWTAHVAGALVDAGLMGGGFDPISGAMQSEGLQPKSRVLAAHFPSERAGGWGYCICGYEFQTFEDWAAHALDELGLT